MVEGSKSINAELVLEGFDAFGRGDTSFIVRYLTPESRWEENQGTFPDLKPVYVGPQGFSAWMEDMREVWEEIRSEPVDITEIATNDGPSFVIEARIVARGREEIEVAMHVFNVLWTTFAPAIARRRVYFDREEALAAARLSQSEIERGDRAAPRGG